MVFVRTDPDGKVEERESEALSLCERKKMSDRRDRNVLKKQCVF